MKILCIQSNKKQRTVSKPRMINFYLFLALGIVLAVTHDEEAVSLLKTEQNVGSSNFSSWLKFFLIPTVIMKRYLTSMKKAIFLK